MSRLTSISEREAGFIEGFAAACDALMLDISGESPSAKSYDPMTVDLTKAVMHSYTFDLKDGGRHHPLADYASRDEICSLLRGEAVAWIRSL